MRSGLIPFYIDWKEQKIKIIIVKQKFSYPYLNFLSKINKHKKISSKDFNGMTRYELLKIINNRDFGEIIHYSLSIGFYKKFNKKIEFTIKNNKIFYNDKEIKWSTRYRYSFPKGKINSNENPLEAALREYQEEVDNLPKIKKIYNLKLINDKKLMINLQNYYKVLFFCEIKKIKQKKRKNIENLFELHDVIILDLSKLYDKYIKKIIYFFIYYFYD